MKLHKLIMVAAIAVLFNAPATFAAEEPALQQTVKEKYALTDDQMKAMQDKGLRSNQMAMVAQLAQSSGRSIDQVLTMRVDNQMGWGELAKELNVKPSEVGHAVSSLKPSEHADLSDLAHERREAKAEARKSRKEARAERKLAREERKQTRAERRAERADRRADRAESKSNRGKR